MFTYWRYLTYALAGCLMLFASMHLQAETESAGLPESGEEKVPAYAVWVQTEQKFRRQLAASNNPRDWLFAMQIPDIYGMGPDSETLNAKIQRTYASDPLIQWLNNEETNNAVRLLPKLSGLYEQQRSEAVTQVLEEMAQADVYDPHSALLIKSAFDVYGQMASGIDSNSIPENELPALKYVTAFSRVYALLNRTNHNILIRVCESADLQRRAHCAAIAQKMITAPGLLMPRLDGFCLLKRLHTEPIESPLAFQDALLLEKYGELLQKTLLSDAGKTARVIADWQETVDQIKVYQRLIEREGIMPAANEGGIDEGCGKRFEFSRSRESKNALNSAKESLIRTLSRSWKPRDWLLAATLLDELLSGSRANNEKRQALLVKAFEAAPSDTFVVQFLLDQSDAPVSVGELANLLVQLEPENLASWLYSSAVLNGNSMNNRDIVSKMLEGAAKSTYYRNYIEDYIPRLLEALNRLPDFLDKNSGLTEEEITSYRYAVFSQTYASLMQPPYREFAVFCSPLQEAFQADQQQACIQVMRAMMASPATMVDVSIAARLLDLFGENPLEGEMDFREYQWLAHLASSTLELNIFFPGLIDKRLADWKNSGNEIEMIRQSALRAGFPLSPPVGWQYSGEGKHEQDKAAAKRQLEKKIKDAENFQ